ncbi:MAG: SCO family protein [Deltaproteobacteria bacterium]|nr:SCO family protein [Deltaproteobacteria bacterium]
MSTTPPDYPAPPRLEWLRKYIWVIGGVMAIVTITVLRPRLRHVPDPPAKMFQLPAGLELVDEHGQPFSVERMQGKVWVAGFVFTSCPSTCPAVTRAMAALRERFDRMQVDVEMISFSVDPVRDTPTVLREYAERVGVSTEHWHFVTGDPATVRALVRDGFKLGIGDREPKGDAGMYLTSRTRPSSRWSTATGPCGASMTSSPTPDSTRSSTARSTSSPRPSRCRRGAREGRGHGVVVGGVGRLRRVGPPLHGAHDPGWGRGPGRGARRRRTGVRDALRELPRPRRLRQRQRRPGAEGPAA